MAAITSSATSIYGRAQCRTRTHRSGSPAAARAIETWQWCAEMDYVYAYLSYFGYKDGTETMAGFWREMSRLGKDRNPNRAAFLQFVGVSGSLREKGFGTLS